MAHDASHHSDKRLHDKSAEMALQVDLIINKYRKLNNDEIEKFHDKISKSADDVDCLRQLFLVMHSTRSRLLPTDVATALAGLICDAKISFECRNLCLLILNESSPLTNVDLTDLLDTLDDQINVLPLILNQQRLNDVMIGKILGKIDEEKLDENYNTKIVSFVSHLSNARKSLHSNSYLKFVQNVLRNASIRNENRSKSNLFRRDSVGFVSELDGIETREFFTILNLSKKYRCDQISNIFVFSSLRGLLSSIDTRDSISDLIAVVLDYGTRVLMQCERRAVNRSDLNLQNACILECVNLLDIICRIDASRSASIFSIVKRLYDNYVSSESSSKSVILIAIANFALNHGQIVAYDATIMVESILRSISFDYRDPIVSFEIIEFLKSTKTCDDIIVRYFPNILKLLAWRPRTFYEDFNILLPFLLTDIVSVEMLHSLVDLPCLTVSLIYSHDMSVLPPISNPTIRSMFAFMLRNKCGIGDTIARLDEFHRFIRPLSNHPRVVNCGEVVPIIIRRYFDILLSIENTDHLLRLVPTILERGRLIFETDTKYVINIQKIFSDNICKIFARRPSLVVESMSDLLDFVSIVDNYRKCNDFYTNLVWIIGEYLSTTHNTDYKPIQIAAYYESLECALHELIDSERWNCNFAKLITTVSTTLAKLSTRSQDLLSRTTLTLSKTARQIDKSDVRIEEKSITYSRISQLIAVLQMPLAASAIFNPPFEIIDTKYHRESVSIPVVLKTLTKLE